MMIKEIKTTKFLKELMKNYFSNFSDSNKKIAWCTSVGPAELLRAFGFEVYFPENHGALMGSTRTSENYITAASKIGYPSDICSYLTSDIGAYLSNSTPLLKHYGLEKIPKPDIIVYKTNQCREVQDWFSFFAKEFNCPIVGINPPRHLSQITNADVQSVTEQMKSMIPICEEVSKCKFDLDKFKMKVKLSKDATELWKKCLQTSKNSPAVFSFFDGTIHMGPIVVLRGTEEAKNYYLILLKELEEYAAQGIGFVQKESCRIYWEGMPIWGKLRFLSELFENLNSAVVASTYCNSWIFDDFDDGNPFESTSLAYTKIFINRSEEVKFNIIKNLIKEFKIDGIIFHDAKTCFNNSNANFGMPLRLKEQTGIESLVIEGDLCDLRFFSEGQTKTKIETFIEQLV